jgi:hypothetical protein
VPAHVKRAVWERDGGRCQWKLDGGGICGSTHRSSSTTWCRGAEGDPRPSPKRDCHAASTTTSPRARSTATPGGVDPGAAVRDARASSSRQTVRADFPHTASLEVHLARLESSGRRAGGRFRGSSPCCLWSAPPCTSDHAAGRACVSASTTARLGC